MEMLLCLRPCGSQSLTQGAMHSSPEALDHAFAYRHRYH